MNTISRKRDSVAEASVKFVVKLGSLPSVQLDTKPGAEDLTISFIVTKLYFSKENSFVLISEK